jgi:D-methionine transport system ATP-binding protein
MGGDSDTFTRPTRRREKNGTGTATMSIDSSSAAVSPVIELTAVQKSFKLPDGQHFDAVHPLSLSIVRGDIFGLVGTSGAGKSTLLRLINLLERPDAGSVKVAGRELTALGRRELRDARQNIGMIFQQFNLLQNATVYDNVAFPLRIHGHHTRAEIDARVRECLALVGLLDKIDSYPSRLSGGQKQRVAIARALAPRPDVLLCDEPTSALDSETTRSLLQTLREINRELGVTIVIVTHELAVVDQLCSHVAVLEHGYLIEQFAVDGPAQERHSVLGRELAELVEERQWRATRVAATAVPSPTATVPGGAVLAAAAPAAVITPISAKVSYA